MKSSSKLLLIVLLGLAVSVRIWMIAQAPSAFCFSVEHVHPDQGVVVLTAKHILDVGEFPLLHYGQAYLGTLESFLLSTCYLVFGNNFWVIHIVPVLCFTVFCFALFLLAKNLYGSRVGLWSLLWCVFATIPFSEYTVMPQLGNISAPMFGTILLGITIKSLRASDLFLKRWGYGLLGLLGGIGWWTSPMIIYYLITIAIFILLKEKTWEIVKGGSKGILLFFLGTAPYFSYFVMDPQLKILGVGEGFSLKNLREGLPLFFLERIHYFLDLDKFGSINVFYFWIGAFVYLGATVYLFWGYRKDVVCLFKISRWPKISYGFILAVLFFVFLGMLSSSIHIQRNAARYFFPLATFFPIALGYGVANFPKPWRFFGLFLFGLLFFIQMKTSWSWVITQAPMAEANTRGSIRLINELAKKGIHHMYSWQNPGSEIINFYSKERIISSRPMLERYRPYEDILERSEKVSFLDPGDQPVLPTLGVIGGSCQKEGIESYQVYRDFNPPLREYREIPPSRLRLTTSDQNELILNMVDRRWDTEWSSGRKRTPDMWIKVDLGDIHSLGMIRLFNQGSQHGYYALQVEIEASSDGVHWKKIIPETKTDYYYWDGPRIYFWELNYRWECRFGPLKARYLVIRNKERNEYYSWKIGELYVYRDIGDPPGGSFDHKAVIENINSLGLTNVYADRWLSAKIKEATMGRVRTVQTFTVASFVQWPQSRIVKFGSKTGFIVDRQNQAGFEEMMDQAGIQLTSKPVGRWNLYYFPDWGSGQKPLENHKTFWWTGFGVLKTGPAVWDEFHRRGLD